MKKTWMAGSTVALVCWAMPGEARAACCNFSTTSCGDARDGHPDPRCMAGTEGVGHLDDVFECWTAGFIFVSPLDPISYLIALGAGEAYCSGAADHTCNATLPDSDCGDTDGDGLYNLWEVSGLDSDGDGVGDLTLPGCDPNRHDLFVEVDCLASDGNGDGDYVDTSDHSHCPNQAAIQQVVQGFADAPVANVDGTTGVQLHVDTGALYGASAVMSVAGIAGVTGTFGDLGGGGEIIDELGNEIIDWDGASGNPATSFYDLKGTRFSSARAPAFRYAIFGHQVNARSASNDCTSGWAEDTGCNDFIVSLGGLRPPALGPCWSADANGFSVGSATMQAGTFMHELGHCLGFEHGGDDGDNGKPNYLSVMNYSFQQCGVPASPTLPASIPGGCDYSRQELAELQESSLDECLGIDSGAFGFGAFDWDGDGLIEGGSNCQPPNASNVPADINGDGSQTTLSGFDDWSAVVWAFQGLGSFANGVSSPSSTIDADRDVYDAERARMSDLTLPELGISVTAPATALPGEVVAVAFHVSSNGRGPALEAEWTNIDPGGTEVVQDIGALRVGETTDLSTSFTVPADACPMALLDTTSVSFEDMVGVTYAVNAGSSTTVLDIVPPVITLNGPASATLECGVATYTELGATAHDTCDPDVPVIIGGDVVDPDHTGTYVVEYTATDDWANQSVATRVLTVADTIAPTFSVAVSPTVLAPPNHTMIEITPTFAVEDACDPAPVVELVGIVSNEPGNGTGDGDTEADILVDGTGRIFLRAERNGNGSARTYTLTFVATDASGNATTRTATVTVPKGSN